MENLDASSEAVAPALKIGLGYTIQGRGIYRTSSKRQISVDLFFLHFSRMENSFSRIILKFILENSREINSRETSLVAMAFNFV